MIKTWMEKLWISAKQEDLNSPNQNPPQAYSPHYLINQETINQIIQDTSQEVFPLLVRNFLEEMTVRSRNIITAIEEEDYATLEFESHTLGSTALAMGATGLGLIARKIETACLQSNPKQAVAHKTEFTALVQQSTAMFNTMLG